MFLSNPSKNENVLVPADKAQTTLLLFDGYIILTL